MANPIRILIAEDSEDDALLLIKELQRGGFDPSYSRIETPEAMKEELRKGNWDLIIADYVLSRFSGTDAMHTLRKTGLDIPAIIVSGKLGEETAVEAMKAGAQDYIMKGNLSRLVPAINRELREASIRKEKRSMENALWYSDKKYNTLLETTQEGIWTLYDDGRISYVNQRMADMLGTAIQEILGRDVTEFTKERRRVRVSPDADRRKPVFMYNNDFKITRKDGSTLWVQSSSKPLYNENDQYIGTMEMMMDITERKLAEAALVESEAKFRHLTEASMAGIFIYQRTRFRYINPACVRITGYLIEELMEMDILEILHPDFKDMVREKVFARLRGERRPIRYEFKIISKSGEERWLDAGATYTEIEGKPAAMAMIMDITDRKEAEESVRESEQLYRMLAERSIVGVYMVQNGKFRYINANAAAYSGFEPEELIGHSSSVSLVHPEDRDMAKRCAREMIEGKRKAPYEFRVINKIGETKWIMETVVPITYQGEPAVLGNSMDMTELRKREEELRQSEERDRTILDNIEDGYYEADLAGTLTFFNKAAMKILGYPRKEMMGLNNRQYMSAEMAKTFYQVFNQVYRTGQPANGFICEFIQKDQSKGFAEYSVSLILDGEGKPAGFRGVIRDVTARIQAQKDMQNMIERLEQSQAQLQEQNAELQTAYAQLKAAKAAQKEKKD